MYCGSCLRDNALATELLARGHDVSLLPIYTPTLTDEPNVTEGQRVFFGGVSVYLQQYVPLFRRTPELLDRLWDSAPVIRAVAGRSVSTDPKMLGDLTVSMLKGEEGFQSKEIRKLVDWLRSQPPFDVINLPNALLLGLAPALRRELGRPLVCTLQGEDLFLEGLVEPYRGQSKALIAQHAPSVDAFVAVSGYYARFMAGYLGIPAEKIETAPLGITLEGHSRDETVIAPRPFTVGYFARVAPEKGLDRLAEAYRRMRAKGLPLSRLEAAGYLAREHEPYLARIQREMADAGLADEFHYRGTLDRQDKIRFFHGLDVLSVPSPYVEPKGLYLLEAMANGLPVVQPRHGAFPEMIESTGGGLLVEPNDPDALAEGILSLFRDRERARELGRRGAEGVKRLYGAGRMAERVLEVYRGVTGDASARGGEAERRAAR